MNTKKSQTSKRSIFGLKANQWFQRVNNPIWKIRVSHSLKFVKMPHFKQKNSTKMDTITFICFYYDFLGKNSRHFDPKWYFIMVLKHCVSSKTSLSLRLFRLMRKTSIFMVWPILSICAHQMWHWTITKMKCNFGDFRVFIDGTVIVVVVKHLELITVVENQRPLLCYVKSAWRNSSIYWQRFW